MGDLVEKGEHGHHRPVDADGVLVEICRGDGTACTTSLDSGSIEVFRRAHPAHRADDIDEFDGP